MKVDRKAGKDVGYWGQESGKDRGRNPTKHIPLENGTRIFHMFHARLNMKLNYK